MQQVAEARRKETADSMVWEATSRVQNPVNGSVGIITQLRQQIMEAEYELAKTQALIALCNAQHHHQLAQTSNFTQSQTQTQSQSEPQSQHSSNLDFDHFWQSHPQHTTTSECLEDFDFQNLVL